MDLVAALAVGCAARYGGQHHTEGVRRMRGDAVGKEARDGDAGDWLGDAVQEGQGDGGGRWRGSAPPLPAVILPTLDGVAKPPSTVETGWRHQDS